MKKSDEDNRHLFEHTAIWQEEKYRKKQGQYPVIFITFKDVKEDSWEGAYKSIVDLIATEYQRHYPILAASLSEFEIDEYKAIAKKMADEEAYKKSLQKLSRYLRNHYQQKVIILIDEYDAPIHAAYTHKYYEQTN